MQIRVPMGIDDFRKLREKNAEYVDKSHLISELIDRDTVEAVVLPRPRRFGKTLNLSMLRWFFEKRPEYLWHLFEDLYIARAGDKYKVHFQRYPVLFISFKDIRPGTAEEALEGIYKKIQILFDEHRFLLTGDLLTPRERRDFEGILNETASNIIYQRSLLDLCAYLERYHGEKVILLIDEYDQPIHAGYVQGYSTKILDFFRAFFGQGLKGNPHIAKAVVTGILRLARESIFSGLNNLGVYTLVREEFSSCFGFSEDEVQALLEKAGRSEHLERVRRWYDGYVFGGRVIYNPWSVLNFLDSQAADAQPYWLNTSSNDLIKHLLSKRAISLKPLMEDLLKGQSIERSLDEDVVLDRLESSDEAFFSLLVFTGYLKAERLPSKPDDISPFYALSIPNNEVRLLYVSTFREWLAQAFNQRGGSSECLLNALLAGDAYEAERHLQIFVTNILSYHDAALAFPEQVYQAFVLGLLASYEWMGYKVRSNRESGSGRPDVLIIPTRPGRPGVVLELKIVKAAKRAPERTLKAALAQIEQKEYAAELNAAGANPIRKLAVAFDGKKVWLRAG